MKDLQEATRQICDLKGNVLALEAFLAALIRVLPPVDLPLLKTEFAEESESARTVLMNALVSEHTRTAFERDVERLSATLG